MLQASWLVAVMSLIDWVFYNFCGDHYNSRVLASIPGNRLCPLHFQDYVSFPSMQFCHSHQLWLVCTPPIREVPTLRKLSKRKQRREQESSRVGLPTPNPNPKPQPCLKPYPLTFISLPCILNPGGGNRWQTIRSAFLAPSKIYDTNITN